jgi:hypothetical protein
MLNGSAGWTVMLSCALAVAGGVSESVTFTVKFAMPAPAGTPVIAPVLLFKLKPCGKLPLVRLQLYGVIPPVAASMVL